ncbi:MAG: hypothetical protein ACRC62_18675 [Microcoleus sp.]
MFCWFRHWFSRRKKEEGRRKKEEKRVSELVGDFDVAFNSVGLLNSFCLMLAWDF